MSDGSQAKLDTHSNGEIDGRGLGSDVESEAIECDENWDKGKPGIEGVYIEESSSGEYEDLDEESDAAFDTDDLGDFEIDSANEDFDSEDFNDVEDDNDDLKTGPPVRQ